MTFLRKLKISGQSCIPGHHMYTISKNVSQEPENAEMMKNFPDFFNGNQSSGKSKVLVKTRKVGRKVGDDYDACGNAFSQDIYLTQKPRPGF